jgi:hypothetical protein
MAYQPGQDLGRSDLNLLLTDSLGRATNAAEIFYTLLFLEPGPPVVEVQIGTERRVPVNPSVGEYYAALLIPHAATAGTYRIRWTFRQTIDAPLNQIVQEFEVQAVTPLVVSPFTAAEREMIKSLRIMLRDNFPDRNYRFRPPEHESTVGNYNRVFGYVWEDVVLQQYLARAVDWFDMFPPRTSLRTVDRLYSEAPDWRTAMYYGAMMFALMALAINWVHDEFSYSIGGVSLDLDKSSKYESLKSNAEQQFDKATEAKARTVKYVLGLQQPRFGIGVRSAFGPQVGRGVVSPRNWL